MKKWNLLVSQNAGEYYGAVIITAHQVLVEWSNEKAKETNRFFDLQNDGNVIIADGVRIEFDESFEFRGETE